jgi:hypothetical protein
MKTIREKVKLQKIYGRDNTYIAGALALKCSVSNFGLLSLVLPTLTNKKY